MTKLQAFSPDGHLIIGTLDTLTCRADIEFDTWSRGENGNIDFEWAGSSEMFYDEQKTVERDGKRVYLDEEGNDWAEDQLVLRTEAEFEALKAEAGIDS
jgi:hypothetical protein